MKRNAYVLIINDSVEVFSNLTKLVKATREITYYPIYRALKDSNRVDRDNITIVKTVIR